MGEQSYLGLPILTYAKSDEWERWLEQHGTTQRGVWIKFAKKSSGLPSITYEEALTAALCHGWIDGQLKSLGATHHLQRFTPRRPRSMWSKRNVERVAELIASGRMRPAGLREVQAAKADGRWQQAYDSPSTSTVPPDLAKALRASPAAKAFFAQLDGINRYAVLHRVQTASEKTRAARIARFVAMLERHETIHPVPSARKQAANRNPVGRSQTE
jgi:uncharacterized protein YdeI (YjbR/CyaY-like superfamily)